MENANLPIVVTTAFLAVIFVRWYYRWITHNSISHIRGPPVDSKLLGNARNIAHQENVGDLDFEYLKEYGAVWRLQGALGSNILVLADAKALQHVLQTSGYNYPKTVQNTMTLFHITGKSIVWAPTGDMHSRHRKVMNPAFSVPQLRSFLPLFRRGARRLTQLWKEQTFDQSSKGATISVTGFLARTTLDVIGEAAFDFDFGALDQGDNEVSKAYENMFADSQLHPGNLNVLFHALWSYLPNWLLYSIRYLPTRELSRFRRTLKVINKVSRQLITEKRKDALANDTSAKDIMSVLVRANASEDPRTRLSDVEMVSQMSVMMFAGHETTANTISWMLWELAKHPDFQRKLREEIADKRREIVTRGDVDFTMDDLENMPYLQAILKETLRYHPIAFHIFRMAGQDDVIPLAEPIRTETGEMISEIPVARGQVITANICTYNRLPSVWGHDAHEWNPERFMESNASKQIKVGMFANLMTFSAGVRSCIGWRFAVIEQQAIIVELIENFRFSLPTEKVEVLRAPTMAMGPLVKGKLGEGFQMPLHVTPI